MRARAVVGASFGDESKAVVVDYLCAKEGAGVVVRYNGGANAGHTVVTPRGQRHVFHHIGSGSFVGAPTFLSQYFVCNPVLFAREVRDLPFPVRVYAHPDCKVTTFADMLANQSQETKRGDQRHGSCGVGLHHTIVRHDELPLTMRDLWDNFGKLESKLEAICHHHGVGPLAWNAEHAREFMSAARYMATCVTPASIRYFRDPLFEGAQGLLLDQDRHEYFPHVTHSKTGLFNVRQLCTELGVSRIDPYYVSRTYLTRHGAGRLPGEDPTMSFPDDTNVEHPFQGKLRFAPLDDELFARCANDNGGKSPRIVFTHCDQLPPPVSAYLHFFGPHRDAVERETQRSAIV